MTKKIEGKMLAPTKVDELCWKWLQYESGNRADSIASVVRSAIRKEAIKAQRKGLI